LLVRAVGWSDPSCGTRNSQRSLSLGEFRPLRLFALPVSAIGGGRAQSPNEARPMALLRMGENGAKRHSRGAAEKGGGRYGYEPPRYATSRYSLYNCSTSLFIIVWVFRFVNAFFAEIPGWRAFPIDKRRPIAVY